MSNVARTAEYFARASRAADWLVLEGDSDVKFDITIRRPGTGETARLYMESQELNGLLEDLVAYLSWLGSELCDSVEGR